MQLHKEGLGFIDNYSWLRVADTCNFDIFKDECGIYLLFTQVFQCSVFVNLWISERKKESLLSGWNSSEGKHWLKTGSFMLLEERDCYQGTKWFLSKTWCNLRDLRRHLEEYRFLVLAVTDFCHSVSNKILVQLQLQSDFALHTAWKVYHMAVRHTKEFVTMARI